VDNLRLIMERRLVDQNVASWNRVASWLGHISHLHEAALASWAGMLAR
jgi:hypothetical protein